MKKILFTILALSLPFVGTLSAQSKGAESFGNTLNVGLGIGYYGYNGNFMPAVHLNYEFDVAGNFTLAPFVTVLSYRNYDRWSNHNYYYRHTTIPMGVKGTYYFDRLLSAGSKWDFYGAGSLGFALRTTTWDNGYEGNYTVSRGTSGLYLDAHLGAEFHASQKLGLFLDLSTGLSTFGLAFHL